MTEEKWTNIMVDSQLLSSLMACPRYFDYKFNRHLVPIFGLSSSIEKGLVAHVGLHAYWKERIETGDYQKASIAGVEAAKVEMLKQKNMNTDEGLEVLQTLVQFFQHVQNSSWIPRAVEQHFKFIAYEDPSIRLRVILTGRIDLIVDTGSIATLPIDFKTESERWFHSAMSNQFKIYALACKVQTLGVHRVGFQKSLEPKEKFKIEMINWDADVLEEFRTQTLPYYCKQYLLYKEENYWPMNTTNCIHGHFACIFSDKYNNGICSVSREVREQKLRTYFTIGEEWDPSKV